MSESMFLSFDEVVELTGRRHRSSQAEALRTMGVDHKIRPDGHVIVLRLHVEQQLGVRGDRKTADVGVIDWSAA